MGFKLLIEELSLMRQVENTILRLMKHTKYTIYPNWVTKNNQVATLVKLPMSNLLPY